MKAKSSFDLTTSEGIKNASVVLGTTGAAILIPGAPLFFLAKFVFDKVFEPSSEVVAAQAKAAEDIIRAGAENNASEIDITMSQEAGAHFKADFEGNPIKFTLGKSGTVKMTVKYKDAA